MDINIIMNNYVVYVIRDPRDSIPLYVGQTCDYEQRKEQHCQKAKGIRPNINVHNINAYIIDLYCIENLLPQFEILEECISENESLILETKWIEKLIVEGYPLLNRWKEHRKIIIKKYSSTFLKEYWTKRLTKGYSFYTAGSQKLCSVATT